MATASSDATSVVMPRDQKMVWVPGGTFRVGSDRHYPEEAPVHRVTIDGFWIDRTPVTNAEFLRFIRATGYLTFAEIRPKASDYPGALPPMLRPGSLVFTGQTTRSICVAGSSGGNSSSAPTGDGRMAREVPGACPRARTRRPRRTRPCRARLGRRIPIRLRSTGPCLPIVRQPGHRRYADTSTSHVGFRCVVRTGGNQ